LLGGNGLDESALGLGLEDSLSLQPEFVFSAHFGTVSDMGRNIPGQIIEHHQSLSPEGILSK
jgi:hypothetical protein